MLQEQLLTPDGAGGNVQHWDDVSPFWTKVSPLSAYEVAQAAQMGTVVDTRIVMRNPGDLTLKLAATGSVSRLYRFTYYEHIYKIEGVIDRGEYLELICSEYQPLNP
jgi:SPP1 family predicted phage head-tail adaptor